MLLVPACKKGVIYYFFLLLFICLFLIFGFARGQREARGDHLRTLDFAEKRDQNYADKKIRRQASLFDSDYKETFPSLPTCLLNKIIKHFFCPELSQ